MTSAGEEVIVVVAVELCLVSNFLTKFFCPATWGCRIHRLFLCRGVRPSTTTTNTTTTTNECPRYDTKQSYYKLPIMLELGGMRSIPSLPLIPGSLWPGVAASKRILSMGQIELKCVLMLNWIVWNRTVLTFKLWNYAKLKLFDI